MPKIRRITIQNFRSISKLEMDATDLTVIVGDNDSGKSNVLRALNLFFNGQTNPGTPFNFQDDYNRYAQPGAKQAKEIVVELRLELPWAYRENNGDLICWRKRWRADGLVDQNEYWGVRLQKKKRGQGFAEHIVEISSRSRVPALLNRIQFEYVPAVRSAEFFRSLRGRIFEVIARASESSVRDSSIQFEAVIGEAVGDLLQDISAELKDESRLRLPNDLTSVFESLDFLNGEKSISLDNRGDGIKARYIPLILKFIAEKSRSLSGAAPTFIWAYEEPENNLEFRRAQALAEAFRKLARDEFSQVLLTTHSPVFYNMHTVDNDGGLCCAYHLSHEGAEKGTSARSAHEATVSLDETMGAMAIIAPHIQAAQEALATATAQQEDLRAKLAKQNNNLPTLFVEGSSEYLIYEALLQRLRPEKAEAVFLAEPPARAGANYVTNMLRSWEYRTRHLPTGQRTRAVGIVDADAEGISAAERFKGDGSWKYVGLRVLSVPVHLKDARASGLEIPICLEELWPQSQWLHAEANGWLEARPKDGLISGALVQRLADEDAKLSELIKEEWKIYFERRPISDVADHAKMAWAAHMVARSTDELGANAAAHLTELDAALAALGV